MYLQVEDPKVMTISQKRIRVDDLLNNDLGNVPKPVVVPRNNGSSNTPRSKRKGIVPSQKGKEDPIVSKVFDVPAPISLKEYFKMRPKAVQSMIQALETVPGSKRVMFASEDR
jgi:hypothetical protein